MTVKRKVFGFKLKHKLTGLFHGPNKIGYGYRWSKTGRTWNSRQALGASIGIWLDACNRRYGSHMPFRDPENWIIVTLTDHGVGETPFLDYVKARVDKTPFPEPVWQQVPLTFTSEEMEMVEEALHYFIGDSDGAGEFVMKVVEALKHFEAQP